jgi:murein DD-endopeptidase MepM/ murein hydrolase activator NlpD
VLRALVVAAAIALLVVGAASSGLAPDQAPVPPARPGPVPNTKPKPKAPPPVVVPFADRPQLRPQPTGPLVDVPQVVAPPLEAGPYVYPVYGPSSSSDAYGTLDSDVGFRHDEQIFGELGQPLVAVADGTILSAGWTRGAGNRFWLRDHQGNLFYYARLSAFTTDVRKGARVRAGQVVGFMGDTGAAAGSRTFLRFEVRPVSLLFLGAAGAVDPGAYLPAWRRLQTLPFPVATSWAPSPAGVSGAPQPGALLIGVTDIASAGLRIGRSR